VFSSHVLSEIEQACDRVVILRRGEVVHDQQMSHVRRGHRIQARLTAPLPPLPAAFAESLFVVGTTDDHVTIDALGELATVLGWLAKLPLAEIRIDPIGLEAVYEQYHGNAATSANGAAA
jgi:ABC-2 type transport system ATP-binding protein